MTKEEKLEVNMDEASKQIRGALMRQQSREGLEALAEGVELDEAQKSLLARDLTEAALRRLSDIPVTKQEPTPLRSDATKMLEKGWFSSPGVYCLVDGQFGSTGKGLAEQKLAILCGDKITTVTTNAGPNSGHTIYHQGTKIVTKQIPSFSIQNYLEGRSTPLFLNAGAIIDPVILLGEMSQFPGLPVAVHPHATVILPRHYKEHRNLAAIASTQKGTGPALADKVMRGRFSVAENVHDFEEIPLDFGAFMHDDHAVIFLSTAQGFSLGLNSGFYPYTTCRECTVQQALSDARLPARRLRKVIATYRTYPIRVGNTGVGNSGGWYSDQQELEWSELGVEPELTTVTGRVRRVATWSDRQFCDSLRVNEPDAIFINFLNYFKSWRNAAKFVEAKMEVYRQTLKRDPDFIMLGFGSKHGDVSIAFDRGDIERYCRMHLYAETEPSPPEE